MNPAIFSKSAKGLILASSLVVASSALAHAQEGTVVLGTAAQMPMTNAYQNPPAGVTALGGHAFDLSSGKAVQLDQGQSASFTGSFKNPQAVYLLVNSFDSYSWYNGATAGTLTLNFSDGTSQKANLTVGGNVREWRLGGSGVIGTTTDPATANVWQGAAQPTAGGGNAVIDMLTLKVNSTGKTLTGLSLQAATLNTNGAPLGVLVSAMTVDYLPVKLHNGDENDNRGAFNGENPEHGNRDADAATTTVKPIASTPATPAEDKSKDAVTSKSKDKVKSTATKKITPPKRASETDDRSERDSLGTESDR